MDWLRDRALGKEFANAGEVIYIDGSVSPNDPLGGTQALLVRGLSAWPRPSSTSPRSRRSSTATFPRLDPVWLERFATVNSCDVADHIGRLYTMEGIDALYRPMRPWSARR